MQYRFQKWEAAHCLKAKDMESWFVVKLLLCRPTLFHLDQGTMTWQISLCICVVAMSLFKVCKGQIKSCKVHKPFAKSLTHPYSVEVNSVGSNVDTLNIIFTWETDWIHLTQGHFLPCWCLLRHSAHTVGFGSTLLICYLYSDMFTPYQGTTRTLLFLYCVYILRKPLLCLQNEWNQNCLCCKSSQERPLLVCLVNVNFGLDCWDICTL